MNLPNKLTVARVVLIPLFLLVYNADFSGANKVACAIFVVASFTDFLDGYFARKYNLTTNFGKIMDPLADKLLVLSAMIALLLNQSIPLWVVIIILARELGITGLRAVAAGEGIIVPAGIWGKIKTVIQMIAIVVLILEAPFGLFLIYVAVALAVLSGLDYTFKLSKHITWM